MLGLETCRPARPARLALLAALLLALHHTRPGPAPRPTEREEARASRLAGQLRAWLERARGGSLAGLAPGATGVSPGPRLAACSADTVLLEGVKVELAAVRGAALFQFPPHSYCAASLGVEQVGGTWGRAGLQGVANITYTDGRYTESEFSSGSPLGPVRTFR